MKIAIIAINAPGKKIAKQIKEDITDAKLAALKEHGTANALKNELTIYFRSYQGLIFIGAVGIAVRLIAAEVKSKFSDPAVVCVDSAGRFAISLLSGHEGGANALAYRVAVILNAEPIITTGTESHKSIVMGIGCRRSLAPKQIKQAILQTAKEHDIAIGNIRLAATIELKKKDLSLRQACAELNLPLVFKSKKELARVSGVSPSKVVRKNIGINGVCEPCALLAGRRTKLIVPKQINNAVTIAFARENYL